MASYNPFYIPSLSTLQKQAKDEANAQINASLAALPKEGDVNTEFAARGRSLQGFDQAFINFVKNQGIANVAQASPPNLTPPTVTSGQQSTAVTADAARAAANASAMLGIGFRAQNSALQSAGAARLSANQAANRKSLFDAITALHQQQGAEKAKYGELYASILDKKKQDAFQAYQAYLANQLGAAQLGATSAFNQGKLDISQQNADTAAKRAADAANKPAAGSDTRQKQAKRKSDAYKYIDNLISHTDKVDKKTLYRQWNVIIYSGTPPQPHSLPLGEWPDGTSEATILAVAKQKYPDDTDDMRIASTGTRTATTTESQHYSYQHIYEAAWKQLHSTGLWSVATSKRLAKRYLADNGVKQPGSQAPTGARPSDTGV